MLLLANAGVLPASASTEDPRFTAEAITTCVSRLLEVKQQQELLASEQKELNEQLRLAHLRSDLLTLLPAGKEGLLKKPDRLRRSLFQRSGLDKLAATGAVEDDC